MAPRSRTGCLTCRLRHLKCDEQQPICRRCRAGKRNCRRGVNLTFRYGLTGSESAEVNAVGEGLQLFSEDQPWVPFSRDLTFVDETGDVEASYISPTRTPKSLPSCPSLIATPLDTQIGSQLTDAVSPAQFSGELPVNVHCVWPDDALRGIPISHLLTDKQAAANTQNDDVTLGLEEEALGFKMKVHDHNQAPLIRHYTDDLACWASVLTAPYITFIGIDVPAAGYLAIQHPILLNALLAFSARHLSRVADYDLTVADAYYEKSVELLIPRLNDDLKCGIAGADEMLLVATIFLRLYEQMNAPVAGVDFQQHLSGSSAFVNAQAHRELVRASGVTGTFLSTLHEATFWSFLRQDIDMALVNQKPPKVELSLCRVTWDFDASDCTWAKWMVWIVAEVASLCFSEEQRAAESESATARSKLREKWVKMKEKCARWWWSKPSGFLPLYYQHRNIPEGRWFPEIWLGSPWHITGIQYYHAAMVLLAVHDPFRLKPGRDYMRIHRQLHDEVLHHAREMVGVCFGKRDDVPARLTLTHAIVACGSWFEEPVEQDLLLDLLREHKKTNGWPTDNVVTNLLLDWGRLE